MIKSLIIVSLAMLFWQSACLAQPKTLPVFVYHDEPPLHLDSAKTDLSQAWAKAMNAQQTRFRFVIQKIARPALNDWVEGESPFMILWANALWFRSKDADIKATAPLFWDADVVVSLRDKPVQFQTLDELIGLRLGVRNGHYYNELMDYFANGQVKRIDSDLSLENYKKLVDGEIDAFLDSRSSILYGKQQNAYSQPIYVSALPHDAYSRHLIVSSEYFELLPFLNEQIEALKASSEWQTYIENFGIRGLVDPFELDLHELNQF